MARVYCRARFHNALGGLLFALISWLFLTLQAALPQNVTVQNLSSFNTEKARVSDPEIAREIADQGGELIADYGAFQFFKIGSGLAARLAGRSGFQSANRHNFI